MLASFRCPRNGLLVSPAASRNREMWLCTPLPGTSTDGSRSPSMTMYFFHLHFDKAVARQPVGLDCPTLDDAIADAEQARVEIMVHDNLDKVWIEIADQDGHIVATVPTAHY